MPNIIQPVRNLPNGTRINGIEHIYQATKPTTRVDGSALVVGDRWYKPSKQTEWIWNGTYWLGKLETSQIAVREVFNMGTSNGNASFAFKSLEDGNSVLVKSFKTGWYSNTATLNLDTNYLELYVTDISQEICRVSYKNFRSGSYLWRTKEITNVNTVSFLYADSGSLFFGTQVFGTLPSYNQIYYSVSYQEIHL